MSATPAIPGGPVVQRLAGSVDAVVHFRSLSMAAALRIVDQQLESAASALARSGAAVGGFLAGHGSGAIRLEVDEGAKRWLALQGVTSRAGAAPLAGLIRQQLLGPLAEALLHHAAAASTVAGQGRSSGGVVVRVGRAGAASVGGGGGAGAAGASDPGLVFSVVSA